MDPTSHISPDDLLEAEEYAKQFNTNRYLCMYAYFHMVPEMHFIIENLVRLITENKARLGHEQALEFGGGPSLLASFILAHQVKSIRFSDYVPTNSNAIEEWINGASDAHDWTDLFDRVIQEYKKQVNKITNKQYYSFFLFILRLVIYQRDDQIGKND